MHKGCRVLAKFSNVGGNHATTSDTYLLASSARLLTARHPTYPARQADSLPLFIQQLENAALFSFRLVLGSLVAWAVMNQDAVLAYKDHASYLVGFLHIPASDEHFVHVAAALNGFPTDYTFVQLCFLSHQLVFQQSSLVHNSPLTAFLKSINKGCGNNILGSKPTALAAKSVEKSLFAPRPTRLGFLPLILKA